MYDDTECSLVVLNARPEDSGVYTCTAKNLAGQVSCKAELTVHKGQDHSLILSEMYKDIYTDIGISLENIYKNDTLC